jgi:hypothetical protein
MSRELQSVDITDSPDLLRLAEEVARTGEGRLLTRGEESLARLVPERHRPRRQRRSDRAVERDPILDIIGMGKSKEPTNIAEHKHEYLAEAFEHNGP